MNEIINQIAICEKTAIDYLLQASKLRIKLMEEYGLENKEVMKDIEPIQVPFAAYETQLERFQEEKRELLDRHDAEKDKMRKHYRNIVIAVCSVLIALIIGMFSTVLYVLQTYEFVGFEQLLTTGEYGTANLNDGIHYNTDE